ncbi:MAG: FAD-binding oxidoreductase [Methylobacteriaceae bacterium]|nr:FAD-binding oxidoreductase [Methylobacteriaceae bacterium]
MSASQVDVVVLGAGMVGVSAALHLQAAGRSVAIVDRHPTPAGETSYGNSGVIEGSVIEPHYFPRDLRKLWRYARNATSEANYHLSALASVAPWLFAYWRAGAGEAAARSARGLLPLIRAAIPEHDALIAQADAEHLVRRGGWVKLYRSEPGWAKAKADAERARAAGMRIDALDAAGLAALEPALRGALAGAMHMRDAVSVQDPGDLAAAYGRLFLARGGRHLVGDARSLAEIGQGWTVSTGAGTLAARDVVVALGPWSDDVFRALGYRLPLGVKRGYHLHYAAEGNATLARPVYDADGGFVLAPMSRGVRLTTGAEFARRDAPPTPVQIDKTSAVARQIFPLGAPVEPTPWLGRRPCLPDMLPVIGRGWRHRGLWFDFGHQHLGLTLGPASGRLLAELVTHAEPFIDPAPYRAERFA